MDEPFGALDAITKAGLQEPCSTCTPARAATIIFVTHDLDEALYLSDRVLVITGNPGRRNIAPDEPAPAPRPARHPRAPGYIDARNLLGQALHADGDG